MRTQFLEYEILVCPYCVKQDSHRDPILQLIREHSLIEHGDIKEGCLSCSICLRFYPIREGVAIFPSSHGPTKYDQPALAQIYIQTQYRDVIARKKELLAKLKSTDATRFFVEPSTGDLSHPQNNYYLDLIGLLGEKVTAESVALDLGCAVGRLSRELARKAKFVVGVDLSFTQIRVAREILLKSSTSINLGSNLSGPGARDEEVSVKLEETEQSNVDFIVADATLLPFRGGAFDVVCTSSVIERVPDAEVFLSSIERVARDGTALLITSPFDWNEKYTVKEKWLGFNAFGTGEGASEEALKRLLRRHHFRPVMDGDDAREKNIPWVTLSDKRHHSVWSVYSAVFEGYRYRVRRLDPQDGVPDTLVKTYQTVFAKDAAFKEKISDEQARSAFKGMEILLVAERQPGGQLLGFVGGRKMRDAVLRAQAAKDREVQQAAEEVLKGLSGDGVFYINELGVLPNYEGAGVGAALLDALIGHARADGYHGFTLATAYRSDKAISLYRRRGFSFLSNPGGLLRRKITQVRTSGEEETDLRPYLYRVDEFRAVGLDRGKAFFELIRPAQMGKEGSVPVAQRISEVFGRAFWHSDDPARRWPVDDILLRLPRMDLIVLAFDESRRAIGYSMFTLLRWRGRRILYADSGGVSGGSPQHPENWQGSHLGSEMMREGLRQLPSDILVARTQNAAIVPMMRKLKPKRILPVDSRYTGDTIELLHAIRDQVPELRGGEIDPSTGIYKHIYREGVLGDYESRLKGDQLQQFEKIMTNLDDTWDRTRGDAVILVVEGIPGVDNPQ